MNGKAGVALTLLVFTALALPGSPARAAFARAGVEVTQDFDKPLGSGKAQTQRVTVAPVPPVTVRAGSSAPVELAFRVAPGFHINSNKPNSELLVPTAIKLSVPTNLYIAVTYPAGRDLSFAFAPKQKLNVYAGDFSIVALVRAARSMPPGRFRVHGDLKYQACDDTACYRPTQVPLAFDVKVGKAAARTRRHPRQSPHVHQ